MRTELANLANAIEAIESKPHRPGSADDAPRMVPTGWEEIDRTLHGGLPRGVIHEWFVLPDPSIVPPPPLGILIHLAWRALDDRERSAGSANGHVIWIGRACWPYPPALIRCGDDRLLRQSIFIDPPDDAARLWAIDQSVRSAAAEVVIADGRGIDMTSSRRLQLAAESGRGGALTLLARPARDLDQLSAAATRWLVRPLPVSAVAAFPHPRWTVELLRCKGMRPGLNAQRCWALECDRVQGLVRSSSPLADRPIEATPALERPARRSA